MMHNRWKAKNDPEFIARKKRYAKQYKATHRAEIAATTKRKLLERGLLCIVCGEPLLSDNPKTLKCYRCWGHELGTNRMDKYMPRRYL